MKCPSLPQAAALLRGSLALLIVLSLLAGLAHCDDKFWGNPVNGLFEEPTNWGGGVPGLLDTAYFDLFGNYTVTFSTSPTNERLIVAESSGVEPAYVGLDLNGQTYTLTETATWSVAVGEEDGESYLALYNGILAAEDVVVGQNVPGMLTVHGTSTLNANGLLRVGYGAHGDLNVYGAATCYDLDVMDDADVYVSGSSASMTIDHTLDMQAPMGGMEVANSAILSAANFEVMDSTFAIRSDATVDVTGSAYFEQSALTVNDASLSIGTDLNFTGTGTISSGSTLTSGWAHVGGSVMMPDGGTADLTLLNHTTTWNVANSLVVSGESATLNVYSGADVDSDYGQIGGGMEMMGGSGTVNVSGYDSTWDVDGSLAVGVAEMGWAVGHLNIGSGGDVTCDGATIGGGMDMEGGNGTVTVDGNGSTWLCSGSVTIGEGPMMWGHSEGTLEIKNGAVASCTSALIGRLGMEEGIGDGDVTVDGSGSRWIVSGGLTIGEGGSPMMGPGGGTITFTVSDGGRVSSGNTLMGPQGLQPNPMDPMMLPTPQSIDAVVEGDNSSWDCSDSLEVGGASFGPGTPAHLTVRDGAELTVANTLRVWHGDEFLVEDMGDPEMEPMVITLEDSTLMLDGGTITAYEIIVHGTFDYRDGHIVLTGGDSAFPDGLHMPVNSTLRAAGTVAAETWGGLTARIEATGTLAIGDAASYAGFHYQGPLDVGAHAVTLNSAGFAELGVITTLDGGSLIAPNGVSLGSGESLVGHGSVNARVAGGTGSVIAAVGGDLDVGDSSFAGFFSDGELYTDVNEVAIFDLNEAVLGSLTVLGDGALGGSLVTGAGMPTDTHSHFLIEQGKNVIGRGLIEGHFKNHGRVHGDGFATLDERIVFGPGWTVSGKGSFVNTLVQGFFNPGDSPTIATGENQGYGGEAVVIIELGGTEPGSGDDNHDQIRDDATIWLYDGPTLSIEPWLDFVPQIGDEFVIMTWQTGLSGSFGEEIVDPWFAGHGIGFQFEYNNVGGPGNLTLVAVPEPSTFVLAAVGLLGIVLCVRRRRRDG